MDTVFFDIDTQVDFMDPRGALFVSASSTIAPNIRRLLEYATAHRITTVSPACAHVSDDPEFRQFGPHCIEGTPGAKRYFAALPALPRRMWGSDEHPLPDEVRLDPACHYVVQKRTFPMFANPWLGALRERGAFHDLPAVAFGVATDVCVLCDVLDLCRAGARVRVVRDAIAGITAADSERALRQMRDAGAHFVTTAEVVGAAAPIR